MLITYLHKLSQMFHPVVTTSPYAPLMRLWAKNALNTGSIMFAGLLDLHSAAMQIFSHALNW